MGHFIEGSGLRISVICPTIGCGHRVDLASRRFHGVPVVGTCESCGAALSLAGGRLDATPASPARSLSR